MPEPTPSIVERLRQVRHVALDMDGTLYKGRTLFPFTNPFLAQLRALGVGYSFLTNNSSKSSSDYLAALAAMGIDARPEQLYTSTQAAIEYFRERLPSARRLFILGTESMRQELAAAGFTSAADDPADVPDAVLVGFDTGLAFSRLCRAAWWIDHGKPFVASHPDRVCPTDQLTVLVDCGAICAALEVATGRAPDAVVGKPHPRILRSLLRRHDLRPAELAMAGDRLYTDMAMAREAGALGVLVLTGEATAAEAARYSPPPDLVVPSIAKLGEMLWAARRQRAP